MATKTLSCLLIIILGLENMVSAARDEARPQQISLEKVGEFYLRIDKELPLGRSALRSPRPKILANGNTVLTDFTWLYFFDRRGKLISINGGKGLEPGRFPKNCVSVTVSDEDEIVALDITRRLNIYDSCGDLETSLIVPPDLSRAPAFAVKFGNLLIVSCLHRNGNSNVLVYDIDTAKRVSEFFSLTPEEMELLKSKNASGLFVSPYFWVSRQGHILSNRITDYRVFEYTTSGELCHVYDERPPHYVSVLDVGPGPAYEELVNSPNPIAKVTEWESTWTTSSYPLCYGEDMFVVRREGPNGYYLDFYSISGKRYLGFCQLHAKDFAFCDSNWIYLSEDFTDTLLVIGKYVALIGEEVGEKVVAEISAESLAEPDLRTIYADDDSIAKFERKGDFNVIDLSGKEQPFRKFLSGGNRHFVIFVRPFYDCPFLFIYESVREFCAKNSGYDIYIVASHPYKEELEFLVKGLELEGKIIPNLEPKLVENMIPSYPTGLIVLNKDGSKVLGTYSAYDLYSSFSPEGGKCIDAFLEEIRSIPVAE